MTMPPDEALERIRLVCSDVDGTLRTHTEPKISERMQQAIAALDSFGVAFVPATGQASATAWDVLRPVLAHSAQIMCCNGTLVLSPAGDGSGKAEPSGWVQNRDLSRLLRWAA